MLQSKALAEKVRLTKTYYPHKNLGIIDLLDKDCSKRTAVEFWQGITVLPAKRHWPLETITMTWKCWNMRESAWWWRTA